MEIWLIRNGEKSGPYPDYEIRSRIEHGELEADVRVWHEGLAGWTEISKLELFRREFEKNSSSETPPPLPKEYLEKAGKANELEGSKPRAFIGRRFWARWLDLQMYAAVWWLGMYFAGQNIGLVFSNPWILLPMYVPWFAIEIWLLSRFRTTPGKWLMGLQVINDDGSALTLKASVWRSVRVLVSGIGFGWDFLAILCQGMSWFTTRRIGKPIWDFLGPHKVVAAPLNPFKVIALVFLFFSAVQLQLAVKGPHLEKVMFEAFPEMKAMIEESDRWYLPVKN